MRLLVKIKNKFFNHFDFLQGLFFALVGIVFIAFITYKILKTLQRNQNSIRQFLARSFFNPLLYVQGFVNFAGRPLQYKIEKPFQ